MKTQTSLPFGARDDSKGFEQKESKTVMMYEENLGRLEQFVEKLIDSYNDLKAENSTLRQQLAEAEQQNLRKNDMVTNLQNERTIMHERVTRLITKIDEWEKSLSAAKDPKDVLKKKETVSKSSDMSDPTFSLAAE